jgi:hypothetical protein
VKNCDRNVVSVIGLLSAAVLAWPGCAEEQPARSPSQSGESSLGAAPGEPMGPGNRSPAQPPENRLDFPPDAGPGGPFLVCGGDDSTYCKVSRPEDGPACAARWEDVPAHLNCGQLPAGSSYQLYQSPRCLMTWWADNSREERCYYDASGKLVASEGRDNCRVWCGGGFRRVLWNYPPGDCAAPMLVEDAYCRADGSTHHPQPPPPATDGGALDAPNVRQQSR